jgi:hypothetical protein
MNIDILRREKGRIENGEKDGKNVEPENLRKGKGR